MSPNTLPDCHVVIRDGQIIGTNDEPASLHGIQSIRYTPASTGAANLGEKVFSFTNKADWIKSASRQWRERGIPPSHTIAIDQKGRICAWGAHFAAAEKDSAYPVDVYMLRQDIKAPEVTA